MHKIRFIIPFYRNVCHATRSLKQYYQNFALKNKSSFYLIIILKSSFDINQMKSQTYLFHSKNKQNKSYALNVTRKPKQMDLVSYFKELFDILVIFSMKSPKKANSMKHQIYQTRYKLSSQIFSNHKKAHQTQIFVGFYLQKILAQVKLRQRKL